MFILCHAAKNEPRKQISASRNRKTFPLGTPLATDGGLRRRGFCVGKRLARIFAIPFCSKFVQTWARAGGKKNLSLFGACYFRVGVFPSKRQRKI
jgi:hypothetical protein